MEEDRFNMAIRKFLKEVGVTSQREIERVVREGEARGPTLRPKDYRPGERKAQQRWVHIPGKHRNKDAAWDAGEDMMITRH